MEELPDFYENSNILFNIYIKKLREHITIYIESKILKTSFYNISDFYLVNKIDNNDLKKELFNKIIEELLDKKLFVAHVFNKTGIVITKNKDDFNNNVWCSNLDFTPLV